MDKIDDMIHRVASAALEAAQNATKAAQQAAAMTEKPNTKKMKTDRLAECKLPVAEATTESAALAQAVDLGLEEFASLRYVEGAASGDATDEDDEATVAAVKQPIWKPSLNYFNDALVALSGELMSAMTNPELVRSELPSYVMALLLEELSRV